MEKPVSVVTAFMIDKESKIVNWTYVIEFSCMIEWLKDLDDSKILKCHYHPKIPADAVVTMKIDSPEEILRYLPYIKTYSDDRRKSDKTYGGLHIWHVTNTDSFKGKNEHHSILAKYNC